MKNGKIKSNFEYLVSIVAGKEVAGYLVFPENKTQLLKFQIVLWNKMASKIIKTTYNYRYLKKLSKFCEAQNSNPVLGANDLGYSA